MARSVENYTLNSADLQDIIIGTICSKVILAGSKETIKQ